MGQLKCQLCKEEVDLPYKCSYCGQYFCDDHRLPEQHLCPGLPKKGTWPRYKQIRQVKMPQKEKPEIQDKIKPIIKSSSVNKSARGPYDHDENYTYTKHIQKQKRKRRINAILKASLLIVVIGLATSYYYELYGVKEFIDINISRVTNSIEEISSSVEEVVAPKIVYTAEIESLIIQYTNIERKKSNLNELKLDERLSNVAREHSKDMAENDFFDHTNLEGETPTDRARRHGYPLYKDLGGGWYTEGIGENIGTMSTGNILNVGYVSNDADSIAQAQVKSWMDSPGHKDNLLQKDYDKIGVGVYYDGSRYFCTQNFW